MDRHEERRDRQIDRETGIGMDGGRDKYMDRRIDRPNYITHELSIIPFNYKMFKPTNLPT
jgi:hypothetical protein